MNPVVGDWVKCRPQDLGRDLGYWIEGVIVQVVEYNPGSPLFMVRYDTGRRGKNKFSNYAVNISDIREIKELKI